MFEIEVPEVYNGVVEIKAIARDAGFRSKVAVSSTQEGIDPVGSCIGIRGNRIQSIVNELQGEKIDVVAWDKDPRVFIGKALSPSEVVHVDLAPEEQTATVVVPDRQLSLAIGKEGQNARLAARLAGWRLDIKGLTEWEAIKEVRQKEQEQRNRLAAQQEAERRAAEAKAAVEAAEAIIEAEAAAPASDTPPVEAGPVVAEAAPVPVLEPAAAEPDAVPVDVLNEDALLEALIQEEEAAAQPAAESEEPVLGLSVDELDAFTLEGTADDDEVFEEEEGDLLPEALVLTPDAGKIRFAEDIVGEHRGGGRRDRRGRRGGAAARGGNRPGPRR